MGPSRGTAAVLAAVALLVVLGAASPGARAHAEFVSASPGPYDILFDPTGNYAKSEIVTVSEAVQPGSATITVANQTGARFDSGPTFVSTSNPTVFSVATPALKPGVFTVTWAAISADDGHFSAGSFYFMIRNLDGSLPGQFPVTPPAPALPLSPLDVTLKAADFLGFAAAFGTLMFVLLLWSPLSGALGGSDADAAARQRRLLLRLAEGGSGVFLASVVAQWLGNVGVAQPAGGVNLLGSPYLQSLAARTALGAAMVILLELSIRRGQPVPGLRQHPELVATIVAGFVAILADAFVTHGALIDAWWPIGPFADAIHLYGAAIWVGGLAAVLSVRRWLSAEAPPAFASAVLLGFSRMAFLAVGLIVMAGSLLAYLLVGTLDNLVSTGYGWLVLGKIGLLAPMVGFGFWNRRTLARAGATDERVRVAAVGKRVRAEVALGVAVLVVAGWLTTVNPSSLPPANPTFTLNATGGDLYAILQVIPYPTTPGNYSLQLQAWEVANGSEYIGVGSVNNTVAVSLPGGTPTVVPLEGPHGYNHFVALAVPLASPGTWHLDVTLSRTNGTAVVLPFDVPIHA